MLNRQNVCAGGGRCAGESKRLRATVACVLSEMQTSLRFLVAQKVMRNCSGKTIRQGRRMQAGVGGGGGTKRRPETGQKNLRDET